MNQSTRIGIALIMWGVAIALTGLVFVLGKVTPLFIFFIMVEIGGFIFFIGLVIVMIKTFQWVLKN